jgi:hypothetical protein
MLARTGLFVVASTLALTASFLGLVALVTASASGLDARLPFYVLALATAFVAGIVAFEGTYRDGHRVLRAAGLAALGAFLLVGLGGEGVAYLLQERGQLVSSHLLVYFLAAGLIGTGLGYLGVRHRGERSRSRRRL